MSQRCIAKCITKSKEANALRLAKKSLAQAEAKYKPISLMPTDIRFYDGLRKVLILQDKVQTMVELYQSGYAANPNNAAFAARLADVYCQI